MNRPSLAATVILAALLLSAAPAVSDWVELDAGPANESPFELLESSEAACVFQIRVPRVWLENVEVEGRTYQKMSLPGASLTGKIGSPGLPAYARWFALPQASSAHAEVVEVEYREVDGLRLYPVQKPLPDMRTPDAPFVVDKDLYSADVYMPESEVETSSACLLRNKRVVQVSVYPVSFNPARSRIRVATRMVVRVTFDGRSEKNVPRRTDTGTSSFSLLQQEFITNFLPEGTTPGSYLVITADIFLEAVQPLADWKNRKGYPAVVTSLSSIPPGDSAAIHSYIQNAYDTWVTPPEYVLLVGDVEYLPAGMHEGIYPPPWGYYYEYGTDHCYSLVAGTDVLSDVFIGRLPVNSAEECSLVVSKILDYETTPDTSSLDWFEYASTVGVLQSGRIFQRTCRKVKEIMENGGYAQVDTLFEGSSPPGFATPADICDSLNDGRTFLLYRGHGAQDGWWTDQDHNILNTGHVDTLTNVRHTPIVVAPTCLANAFFDEAQECMGEAFLLQEGGAVGYFGATDVSYSFWNDSLAIGIFRGIFEEGAYHFQQACNYGKLFMEKYFPLSDPDDGEITAQEFFFMNIVGDPELPLWTDTPRPLVAIHVDTVGTGPRFLNILVESEGTPLRDALVCVMKGSETYSSGYTDGSGWVELLVTPLTEGNMDVTATGQNCLPYLGQIAAVSAPQAPELLLPHDADVFADSMVQFAWSKTVPDSGTYAHRVAKDSMLTVDPITTDSIADTTYALQVGLDDGIYFWGVEAFNINGIGSGYQYHRFSFTVDCTPPQFAYTTVIHDTSFSGPFDVYSMITDLTGVSGPLLNYRVSPDTAWSLVPMDSAALDSFHSQIPAQPAGATVDYYLFASDLSDPANSSTDPPDAPVSYFSFDILSVGVQELKEARVPGFFDLGEANPNPFLSSTHIHYQTPKSCHLRIAVYDAAGRLVNTIVDETLQPGYYRALWDGTDTGGRNVNSGVYFCRMETPSFVSSKKVLLLK
jgi:hypothetical protein